MTTVKKSNHFTNLPIELQDKIVEFILQNYNEKLQIGDIFYCNYYGIGKITNITFTPNKENPEELTKFNIFISSYHPDLDRKEKNNTSNLAEFLSHKNKIETSVEK